MTDFRSDLNIPEGASRTACHVGKNSFNFAKALWDVTSVVFCERIVRTCSGTLRCLDIQQSADYCANQRNSGDTCMAVCCIPVSLERCSASECAGCQLRRLPALVQLPCAAVALHARQPGRPEQPGFKNNRNPVIIPSACLGLPHEAMCKTPSQKT